MPEIYTPLAKTRSYLYLLFVVEFVELFTRQISNLTGFDLKRIVYGFVAICVLQIVMLIMYNIKYTGEISIKLKSGPVRKGNKKSKKNDAKYNDMLNCAARIRVFLIISSVMMILQILAFSFIGQYIFELMMIISEMICLLMCLMNLTQLQRM